MIMDDISLKGENQKERTILSHVCKELGTVPTATFRRVEPLQIICT